MIWSITAKVGSQEKNLHLEDVRRMHAASHRKENIPMWKMISESILLLTKESNARCFAPFIRNVYINGAYINKKVLHGVSITSIRGGYFGQSLLFQGHVFIPFIVHLTPPSSSEVLMSKLWCSFQRGHHSWLDSWGKEEVPRYCI